MIITNLIKTAVFTRAAAIPTSAKRAGRKTPPKQSEILVSELKNAGKENLVEAFYVQPGEGHGFYEVEHNVKLYDTFLGFFDRHIGAKKQ